MIQNLLYLLLLLAGFPTGLLLSKLCKDEIKKWRKRLFAMCVIALFGAVMVSFLNFEYKFPVIVSLFFIVIVCLTVVWKSH